VSLIEAHWSHFDSVFSISVGDLRWCEVNDWQSDVFVAVELEDGRSPALGSKRAFVLQDGWRVFVVGFGLGEDGVLHSLEFHGGFVSTSLLIEPDWSFFAVDGDVLDGVVAQQSEVFHLAHLSGVFERSESVVLIEVFVSTGRQDLAFPVSSSNRCGVFWRNAGLDLVFLLDEVTLDLDGIFMASSVGVDEVHA